MIYVDDLAHGVATDRVAARVSKRNGDRWCHMVADSAEELQRFAHRLGLRPEWIQHAGTAREHFDLTPLRRLAAVNFGAKEITRRELVTIIRAKRRAAIELAAGDCSSCGEECAPAGECRNSKRGCGHHCNHSWSHDSCCWCGSEFGEEAA